MMQLYDWSFEGPVSSTVDIKLLGGIVVVCTITLLGVGYWYWQRRRQWLATPSGRLYGTLQDILGATSQGKLKPGVGMTLALAACKQYWLKTEQQPVLAMTDGELREFLVTRQDQLSQAALYLLSLGSRFDPQGPTAERVIDAIALAQTAIWR